MDFWKILFFSVSIAMLMTIAQVMNVQWILDTKSYFIINEKATSALNLAPFNENIKLLLENPQTLYKYIESFELEKGRFYTGVMWFTGVSETSFLRGILYVCTFIYFFCMSSIFAKASTIFLREKEQKIFFVFLLIIYFIIIKMIWSM